MTSARRTFGQGAAKVHSFNQKLPSFSTSKLEEGHATKPASRGIHRDLKFLLLTVSTVILVWSAASFLHPSTADSTATSSSNSNPIITNPPRHVEGQVVTKAVEHGEMGDGNLLLGGLYGEKSARPPQSPQSPQSQLPPPLPSLPAKTYSGLIFVKTYKTASTTVAMLLNSIASHLKLHCLHPSEGGWFKEGEVRIWRVTRRAERKLWRRRRGAH